MPPPLPSIHVVERAPVKPQQQQQSLNSIQPAKPPQQTPTPTQSSPAPCVNASSRTPLPSPSGKPSDNAKPVQQSTPSAMQNNASSHAQDAQHQQPSVAPTSVNTNPTEDPILPPVGSRIQVLWNIDYDADAGDKMQVDTANEQNTVTRWWGATVQDRLKDSLGSRRPQHAHHQLHVLLYDAYQEFAEDTATVAFISHDTLVDLSQLEDVNKGQLQWRFEHCAQRQTECAQDEKSQLVSLEEYAADLSAAVQDAGLTEETDLQILSTLPLHVQSRFASGYRRFADTLKNSLDKFLQEKPKDYVVTKADVQKVFASIHSHPL